MTKKTLLLILLSASSMFIITVQAQELSQSIRGKVTDKFFAPLAGANIRLTGTTEHNLQTDERGVFSRQVPVGRYKLAVSFTGFETQEFEVVVNAGRETVVNISMMPSATMLGEVQIESSPAADEVPGLRSLSIEKALRIPANFFDPVRVATAFPAVVAANDQNNSIVVRGNSPNGLLWRLNGLDIVNPNHLANAGTFSDKPAVNGGGVNILSAQMLDRTNFYSGAFPAQYGNALSGILDMNLRQGNTGKKEYTAQASLIGLDIAAEGPLNGAHTSSFLANYRYSTVGLLSALGVDFGGEAIGFQDFSFGLNVDQKNGGNFTIFGLWGSSKNDFERDSAEWEEDKDRYEILYRSKTYAFGMTYNAPVSRGNIFVGLAYSASDQSRNADASMQNDVNDYRLLFDHFAQDNAILSGNIKYTAKAGNKSSWEIGTMTNYLRNDIDALKAIGCLACLFRDETSFGGSTDGVLLQPYANWNTVINSTVSFNAGVRYLNYTYSSANSIEPRIQITVKPAPLSAIDIAYSLVSQLQTPQVYLAQNNDDLGFTKAHHVDLAYRQTLSNDLQLRGNMFYQSLFDVPVENDPGSTFSVLNLVENIAPADLVNDGKGENYGVEVTLEKLFFGHQYFLAGASYYDSKYTAGDGIKRNTRFNGNYTVNGVYGKEWKNAEKGRTVGVNLRLLYLGGLRESDVLVNASQAAYETVYDTADPFNRKLKDYMRLDARLSFKKNKPGYTRTFAIDIQNLTGRENEAYHYYDFTQQKIVTKFQLGLIPVLAYRIDF